MNKKEIAQVLDEMALLMDIRGENPFKVKAYANAARLLTGLDPEEFDRHVREGTLGSVRGIGKNLSARIHGLAEEGFLYEFEDLKKSVPPGLILMLQIPGLGPKKIKAVYEQLHIETVADLETACREGRCSPCRGSGRRPRAGSWKASGSWRNGPAATFFPWRWRLRNVSWPPFPALRTRNPCIWPARSGAATRPCATSTWWWQPATRRRSAAPWRPCRGSGKPAKPAPAFSG